MTKDLSSLCIHTMTTRPWSLEQALENYVSKGVGGISVWQNAIEEMGAVKAGGLLASYPIEVVSYVRGGFFPHPSKAKRQQAIDWNHKLLEEAAAIKAPLLVLVTGSSPDQPLETSRSQIQQGIESILPMAESLNIKLAIEPLHPMYAHSRSAINTLQKANDIAIAIGHDYVGVAIDVYHVWWEETLEYEIMRSGKNNKIFAYHICDYKAPLADFLNDRGLMGDGCIDVSSISATIKKAGFNGFREVEVFSNTYWAMDQSEYLDLIIERYEA